MTPRDVRGLVSPSDIAEMAGVSRAAVSNWRASERTEFPRPAGGSEARPLFDVAEVEEWLTGRGHAVRKDRGERQVWSTLNRFRGEWSIETINDALLSVLTARRLATLSSAVWNVWSSALAAGPKEVLHAFTRLSHVAQDEDEEWRGLVHLPSELHEGRGDVLLAELAAVISQVRETDLAYLADNALSRVAAAQARSAGEHGLVGSRVATLLVGIARHRSPQTIYDPACGIAETLIRAREALGSKVSLIGHDVNVKAVRIARQRSVLAGINAELTVADILAADPAADLRADLVLLEPPFGLAWHDKHAFADPRWVFGLPPKSSSELLWIQHAIFHLGPGGRAYVITSGGPSFRIGAEGAIRTELIRRGCIEAVIGLPGKMLPHTSVPLTLWALCRPGESRSRDSVLLVDASEVARPEERIGAWLNLGEAQEQDPGDAPPYARIDVRDLLANDAIVQPQRWVGQPTPDASEITSRYRRAVQALTQAQAELLKQELPTGGPIGFTAPRLVTIRELAQQGSLSLAQGRLAGDIAEDLGTGVITPRDIRDDNLTPANPAEIANLRTVQSKPEERTQLGDVLVTTWNEVRAIVDSYGEHLLARGVHRLRVDPTLCDPEYLAYCLSGGWNNRHQAGTTIKRADIKALEVPLIPLEEQRQVVAVLKSVDLTRAWAQALANAATDHAASLLALVRYGVKVDDDDV